MRPIPDISMKQLREVGRRRWDLIWANTSLTNQKEIDHYLATAAVRLWNGESEVEVADYLIVVETECVGVDTGSGMRERALHLAHGIRAYLDTLQPGQVR